MRLRKNWPLFFYVVAAGLSINHATQLLGINRNAVFYHARRNNEFRKQLDRALEMQARCLKVSPFHFVDPATLEPILDDNLDFIPRKPPHGLRAWVRDQMTHHPLNTLAA